MLLRKSYIKSIIAVILHYFSIAHHHPIMSFKELFFLPLLPLIAAKSQKRQRHSAGKAGEPPPIVVNITNFVIADFLNGLQDADGWRRFSGSW